MLAPFSAEDARGLLKTAIRSQNPVVFLESEILYNSLFEVSDQAMSTDFTLPIGKAEILRKGTDVTITGFQNGLTHCLLAAEQLEKEGISCEIINLRSIRPLDR